MEVSALPSIPAVSDAAGSSPVDRGTRAVVPSSLLQRRDLAVYDVAIVGAGCAGLSACLALLEAGMTGPIVLLDSREQYLDDRTWCFWDVEPTPFSHLARASWTTWMVRDEAGAVRVDAPETPYLCLAATDFYTSVLASIAAYPNVELRLGGRIGDPDDHLHDEELYGLASVATPDGPVRARHIIDSRGLAATSAEIDEARRTSTWVPQQFAGLHIVADRDVFDPAECRLMDFGVDQGRGPRFLYVLPVSASEALVEVVSLAAAPFDSSGVRGEIDGYLASEFGLGAHEFTVIGDERGYIPMTDHRFVRHPSPHVTRMGMAGGATRPSTGYTFLGIQRSCRDLVAHLVDRRPDATEPACSLLDAVFLRFLATHPAEAPRVFGLLFRRVPTPSLVRFLTERSGTLDHLRLILALPKLPFLATAGQVIVDRARRRLATASDARRV